MSYVLKIYWFAVSDADDSEAQKSEQDVRLP